MGDSVRSLTVVLSDDYRDEDVRRIRDAILMLKGVSQVLTHGVSGADWLNRTVVRMEYRQMLLDMFENEHR